MGILKNVVFAPHAAVGEAVMRAGKASLYHKLGYKVYVSPNCQLRANREAYELLYLKNPCISGERIPSGDDLVDGLTVIARPFSRVEFDPGILNWQQFSEAERTISLPYAPQARDHLTTRTVIDVNISQYRLAGGRDDFSRVKGYVKEHFSNGVFVVRRNYDVPGREFRPLFNLEGEETELYDSIYDYCDILFSASRVVCLHTGSIVLATCLNRAEIVCLRTEQSQIFWARKNRITIVPGKIADVDLTCDWK